MKIIQLYITYITACKYDTYLLIGWIDGKGHVDLFHRILGAKGV